MTSKGKIEDAPDPGLYDDYSAASTSDESPSTSVNSKTAKLKALCYFIRANEPENFLNYVWNAPELLYNGDGTLPLVKHKGEYYNFMQIAVLFNNHMFCQLILNTLEHPQFFEALFPFFVDEDAAREEMKSVIRLYLNSSSSSGETPLHYASEYGLLNCCKILLSHPLCKQNTLNKKGFPVNEVICLKTRGRMAFVFDLIQELFTDGMLYVPVYRFCGGSRRLVGKPTPCQEFNSVVVNPEISSVYRVNDRQLYHLNAFAGPMSRRKAELFYTILSNPLNRLWYTQDEKNDLEQIIRTEPERGIEKIGRSLATCMNVDWKEFFTILNVFTNLAADDGLEIMENFLLNRRLNRNLSPVLPSTINVEDKKITCLKLLNLFPPINNPLCHRANSLYCFSKKFITVEAGFQGENEDKVTPAEPRHVTFDILPSRMVPLESTPICLNGMSLTELDKDVYEALKKGINFSQHIEVSRWIEQMGTLLQIEHAKMGVDFNLIPAPRPHCWD